jgi:hypothetical protein
MYIVRRQNSICREKLRQSHKNMWVVFEYIKENVASSCLHYYANRKRFITTNIFSAVTSSCVQLSSIDERGDCTVGALRGWQRVRISICHLLRENIKCNLICMSFHTLVRHTYLIGSCTNALQCKDHLTTLCRLILMVSHMPWQSICKHSWRLHSSCENLQQG